MALDLAQFNEVMSIISHHHSTTIKLNMPIKHFVGDLGTTKYRIHITKCCAGLSKDLHHAGYSLDMDENGMNVFKIE